MGGSAEYFELVKDLPEGPRNLNVFCDYPRFLGDKIFACEGGDLRLQRVLTLLGRFGTYNISGFTCRQGDIMMLLMAADGLRHRGHLDDDWIVNFRGSEPLSHLRSIAMQGTAAPLHIYKEEQDVHWGSGEHADAMKKLRPNKNDSAETRVEKFEQMRNYVEKNHASIFSDNAVSMLCECHPQQKCPCRPKCNRLRLAVTGFLCRPWTVFGRQAGYAHESEESRIAYFGEMKYSNMDCCFSENSSKFPAEDFVTEMAQAKKLAKFIVMGPDDIGWPASGDRFLSATINEQRLVWVGPDESNLSSAFLSFFQCQVVADGTVFITDPGPGGEIQRHCRALYAKKRKIEYVETMGVEDVLCDSAASFFKQYSEDAEDGMKVGTSGACIADVSQNPAIGRGRAGPWLPRLARSTQLVVVRPYALNGYILTERDLSAVYGWPVLPEHGAKRKLLNWDLGSFNQGTQQRVLGEGWHLPLMVAWFYFVTSHLIWRDPCNVPRVLAPLHLQQVSERLLLRSSRNVETTSSSSHTRKWGQGTTLEGGVPQAAASVSSPTPVRAFQCLPGDSSNLPSPSRLDRRRSPVREGRTSSK